MNKYCSKSRIGELKYNLSDLKKYRDKRDTKYYSSYKDIIDFYRDQKQSNNLMNAFLGEAVVMFLLLVLILVTFVIFLAHCCCKFLSSNKKPSLWMTVSMVIVLIVFLLFLIFMVVISMAEHRHNSVICLLMRLPGGTLEGFDEENVKFVGIKGIA